MSMDDGSAGTTGRIPDILERDTMEDRTKRCSGLILLIIMILCLTACTGTAETQSMSVPLTAEQTQPAPSEETTQPVTTEEQAAESGSTQEEPDWGSIPFQPMEYQLGNWYMGETIYLGPDGELVTTPAFPVRDLFTGEVRYYIVPSNYIASQIGWRDDDTYFDMLFDLQGNLLEKRLEGGVGTAVGDLLVRSYLGGDVNACGLWDPRQDRVVVEDIIDLYRLDADTALVTGGDGNIRGTMDRETLKITEKRFEQPLGFDGAQKGLIFARFSENLVVLDEDLEEVYRSETEGSYNEGSVFDLGEAGKFFSVNDRNGGRILRVKGGEAQIVYESVHGSMALLSLISCVNDRMVVGDHGETFLCDLEGNRLTKPYESMGLLKTADGSVRYGAFKERTIYILGPDGEILNQKKIEGLQEVSFDDGVICYVKANGSGGSGYENSLSGLMDEKLCDIIPEGLEQTIYTLLIGEGPDYVWIVSRQEADGYRYDIYDSAMKPIVLGASMIGTATEHGMAIRKGFYQGVMDYEGNWIARHSIYEDEWRD